MGMIRIENRESSEFDSFVGVYKLVAKIHVCCGFKNENTVPLLLCSAMYKYYHKCVIIDD